MKIINPITYDVIKPIRFEADILNDNGEYIGIRISNTCKLYDDEGNELPVRYDPNGRPLANLTLNEKDGNRTYPLTRIALISFANEHHPYSYYSNLQVDHINPSIPLNNDLNNLEWVSREENMRRAGETGVMIKKYKKDLVHKICQMIVDGYSRLEIREKLNVNGQLIDDIKSGRSHKSVSSLYINKGFKYKTFNRDENEALVRQVCEMLQEGYRNIDISKSLDVSYCFVSDIKHGRTFKNISSEYNF